MGSDGVCGGLGLRRWAGALVCAALVLGGGSAVPAGAAGAVPEPSLIDPDEDCTLTVEDNGTWRWRCPVDATPGWARIDVEVAATSLVMLVHGGRDDRPTFQAIQGWRETEPGVWPHIAGAIATWGHSTYERTVIKVGDIHEEEEKESDATTTHLSGAFGFGMFAMLEPGRHSLILSYAWHHTASPEDTFLEVFWQNQDGPPAEGLVDWTVTNHPGRVWLYDDSDFDVHVAQVRRDGTGGVLAGDPRGYNAVVDATLAHTAEASAAALFWVRGMETYGAVGLLGIESATRSCRHVPSNVAPFGPPLIIPPSPPGEYTFHIEAKVERHHFPHSLLLLSDLDVPVQPWPPRYFVDDTVNETVMGTFCDGA